MKEGDKIDIQYTANYNYELSRWIVLERTTYPILWACSTMLMTEVDISYGYDKNISTHSNYIEYLLHTSHDLCYDFYLFDKKAKKWTGIYK